MIAPRPVLPTPAKGEMRATLVVLSGWEIGREFELTRTELVIGRSARADVTIPEPEISRRHACIVRSHRAERPSFEVLDLGSSNGVFVNDLPVRRARLNAGDKIRLGPVVLMLVVGQSADGGFFREVHRRINYDQLTGLLTMESFSHQVALLMRSGMEIATLAMTDLDGLKRVNDTHGHLAGRMVVREMGAMIRSVLRPKDLAGLYGGDETVIFFPDTAIEEAVAIAEGLRTVVADRVFQHDGASFSVTITQGLAQWPDSGDSVERLIAAADRTLYTAKAAGRNCVMTAP